MFARKRLLVPGALVAASIAIVLSGCASTVALDPAADATDPGCAEIMVRLPTTVGDDQAQRFTNAQATSAWGSPASVLLRCGVEVPGPSTLPCINITPPGATGVDWIEDDSQKPSYTYTTFGRSPAVQVVVDSNAVSATTVLTDLNSAMTVIPATGKCTNPNDVLGTGGDATTPGLAPADGSSTAAPTGGTGAGTGSGTPLPTAAPTGATTPTQFATTAPAN